MGSSVPMAVVVRARPTSRLEMANPVISRTRPTQSPRARLTNHPTEPRFSGVPDNRAKSIS